MHARHSLLVLSLLSATCVACSAEKPAASVQAESQASTQIPPALLGKAPPPSGSPVHYYEGHPETTGYLAEPPGEGPFPALILIHEWNGLVDRVRQVADAFAQEGYVALAADLFEGRTGATREENMALVRAAQAKPEMMIENLNAAVDFLRQRDDVTGKIGAMGWCFGGGVALSFALGGENHDATAIFYGRLVDDPERLRRLSHEIYGTFAGNDRGIPVEAVNHFAQTLREIGIPNDIHIYDDVDHGFWLWVDRNPEASLGPAADAWERLKAYLNRTLR